MSAQWTIRVCKLCGDHHGRLHDGCVTHSHPMYPQATEHAGIEKVDVVPLDQVEALKARLRQEVDAHRMTLHPRALPFTDEEWQGYLSGIPGLEEGR